MEQDSNYEGAFYAQGKRIMLTYPQQYIELWETQTGKHLASLSGPDRSPDQDFMLTCAAITPDGTRAYLGGMGMDALTVFDVPQKRVIEEWGGINPTWKDDGFYSLAISPDGKYLLLASFYWAELRSVATGDLIRVLLQWPNYGKVGSFTATDKDQVHAFGFSPDGRYVITSGGGEDAFLISAVPSGRPIQRFHWEGVYQVLFSPNGRYLLTLSTNTTTRAASLVRLWDWRIGKLVRQFKLTGENWVNRQVAFTPNGKQLVANGQQMSVWDVQTGREVRRFPKPPLNRGFGKVRVSPNGQYVLSVGGNVALWRLATGEFVRAFPVPK